MRKPIIYILGAVVVIAGLAIAWYLASPLFINRTVDEAFPVVVPPVEELEDMSEEELVELESEFIEALPPEEQIAEMPPEERQELEEKLMQIATVMPTKVMNEPMPTTLPTVLPEPTPTIIQEPVLVTQGDFYGADDFHQGRGDAFIYQNPDGSYFLRFENFEVTNGPQLHVILGRDPNPFNHDTLGDYLDLGPLKGNIGDQNYTIPVGTDLKGYGSVVIYCVPFRAIFAIAPIR
jgi:DNA-directed RNA polymerase subunit F